MKTNKRKKVQLKIRKDTFKSSLLSAYTQGNFQNLPLEKEAREQGTPLLLQSIFNKKIMKITSKNNVSRKQQDEGTPTFLTA